MSLFLKSTELKLALSDLSIDMAQFNGDLKASRLNSN
jgi:hypothetical protein